MIEIAKFRRRRSVSPSYFSPKTGVVKDSGKDVELKAVGIEQISYQLNHNKVIVPSQLTESLRHCGSCGRSPFCRAILQQEKDAIHVSSIIKNWIIG